MIDHVGVTVVCKTFNHEKYIAEALDGFIKQRTSFRFRVIVHDDASTDHTADIIRKYEKEYPDIITGIYQSENLYSRGIPSAGYILPHIKSDYVAICEGDDYWINESKLQKQYDALESNKNSAFCVHRVNEVNEKGDVNGVSYPAFDLKTGEIDSRSFIIMCETYSFHTSSFFARTSEWIKYISNPPEFRKVSSVGDVCTLLYFGQLAKVYYIDEVMSYYRRGVAVSWSMGQGNPRNTEKYINHLNKMILTMKKFNEYTYNRYEPELRSRTAQYYYIRCVVSKDARKFLRESEMHILKYLSLKHKIILILATIFPNTMLKIYLSSHDNMIKKRF